MKYLFGLGGFVVGMFMTCALIAIVDKEHIY